MTEYEALKEEIITTAAGYTGDIKALTTRLMTIIAARCVVVNKKPSDIDEEFLSQAIREMLFSFRKHSGDLNYCVNEIRMDFEKAGWRPVIEIKKEE